MESAARPPVRLARPPASHNLLPYAVKNPTADHDHPDNRATYHATINNSIANYNHPIDNNNNSNNNNNHADNHTDNYAIHDINNNLL